MPLLAVENSSRITIKVTIRSTTAERLNAYASFTKSDPSAVVDEALRYIYDKDTDFATYLTTKPVIPQQLSVVKRQTRKKTSKTS
jgi:hypothetical protein